MSNSTIKDDTPVAMLTVGQLKEALGVGILPTTQITTPTPAGEKKYVYGIAGIASLFHCSIPTANRIKASGKIGAAITQIGHKIIVDADLALELAGRKTGGRRVR